MEIGSISKNRSDCSYAKQIYSLVNKSSHRKQMYSLVNKISHGKQIYSLVNKSSRENIYTNIFTGKQK